MGEVEAAGTILEKAGGGIIGAVALLLVALGIGVALYIWRAYQKTLAEAKAEDKEEKDQLRAEVKALREEGKEREEKLLALVTEQQRLQQDVTEILREIRTEQSAQGKQLAALQAAVAVTKP